MHYDFQFKIDRVASMSKEDFNKAEIDWLLNEAQWVYLKNTYGITRLSPASFERNQKRIDDLSTLHIKHPVQPSVSLINHNGVYELDLSSLKYPYLFLTRATVEIIDPLCSDEIHTTSLNEVENDDLNSVLDDPFNNASPLDGVPANFGKASNSDSSAIFLYPGKYTLGQVKLEYLRKPTRLNYGDYQYIDGNTYPISNCILPEHTHSEIVDYAVQIASGIIEDPNYLQLKTQKIFNNE